MKPHTLWAIFATLLPLLPAAAAAGEDNATREPLTLKAVTVTASKREGSVKDFPGNVSVMKPPFIEKHGIGDLKDLTRFAPNVYVKDTSSGSIVCRGISTIDTALFSPMGLYVDDVAYPKGYRSNQDLFDVERVEVLRGPQGALYGRHEEIDANFAVKHVNPFLTSTRDDDSRDTGAADFGQATYEPFARLRLEASRSRGRQTDTSNAGPVSCDDTLYDTEVLPMASLSYDFSPQVMAYATVSRGYRVGAGEQFFDAANALRGSKIS